MTTVTVLEILVVEVAVPDDTQAVDVITDVGTPSIDITVEDLVVDVVPEGVQAIDVEVDDLSYIDIEVYPPGTDGPPGPPGPQGPVGPKGDKGDQGITGVQGPQGATGATGPTGPAGAVGATGPAGPQGPKGDKGLPGTQGPTGAPGPTGPVGPAGANGATGPKGDTGAQGPMGQPGPAGSTGPIGPAGPEGPEGPEGPQGPGGTGPAGPAGPQGDPGPTGPKGDIGATGPAGPQGNPGPTGAEGPEGPIGPEGPQGIQGVQGVKGDTGLQGNDGDPGIPGAPGPQGVQGETGPAGPQGPGGVQGPQGPQGEQGLQGTAGTGITMKGSVPTSGDLPTTGNTQGDAYIAQDDDSLWIWDGTTWVSGGPIQGPQGAQGPQGPQGVKGDTGTQGPQGDQGIQGIQGPVGETGAKGDTGDVGPQGIQGEVGPQGPQGVKGDPGDLSEAPVDDKTYGRKNATWVEVLAGGWVITNPNANSILATLPAPAATGTSSAVIDAKTSGIPSLVLSQSGTERLKIQANDTVAQILHGNLLIAPANGSAKVTIGAGVGGQELALNKAAGSTYSRLAGYRAGLTRWWLDLGDSTAEAGSDTGSNFQIRRYADGGAVSSQAMLINRASGVVTFGSGSARTPGALDAFSGVIDLSKVTASGVNQLNGTLNGSMRWGIILGNGTLEGGSNAGSDFELNRFDDAGTDIKRVMTILRATGGVKFGPGTINASNFATDSAVIQLSKNGSGSGKFAGIVSSNNAAARWNVVLGDSTAETGSNVGSDFGLQRFNDAGAYVDSPIYVKRNDGMVHFSRGLYGWSGDANALTIYEVSPYRYLGFGSQGQWAWAWDTRNGNLSYINSTGAALATINSVGTVQSHNPAGFQVTGVNLDGSNYYQDLVFGNPNWNWEALRSYHAPGAWAGMRFQSATQIIEFILSGGGGYGEIKASAFTPVSDERGKEGVLPLGLQHDAFMGIVPIEWRWPDPPEPKEGEFPVYADTRMKWGFSAQNLVKNVPLAVNGDIEAIDGNGKPVLASVDTVPIVAMTVLEVQELFRELAELRARVEKLEV